MFHILEVNVELNCIYILDEHSKMIINQRKTFTDEIEVVIDGIEKFLYGHKAHICHVEILVNSIRMVVDRLDNFG